MANEGCIASSLPLDLYVLLFKRELENLDTILVL